MKDQNTIDLGEMFALMAKLKWRRMLGPCTRHLTIYERAMILRKAKLPWYSPASTKVDNS